MLNTRLQSNLRIHVYRALQIGLTVNLFGVLIYQVTIKLINTQYALSKQFGLTVNLLSTKLQFNVAIKLVNTYV